MVERNPLVLINGQIQELPSGDTTFNAHIPVAPNLIKDPLLREFDGTSGPRIPLHMSAVGLSLESVHPYTKGFEHIWQATNLGTTSDFELATSSTPFWESAHNEGPRFPRGGLAGGWGGNVAGSHILKMTAVSGATNDTRSLFFTSKLTFQASYLRFRAYIKLSVGNEIGVGSHAGHRGQLRGGAPASSLISDGQQSSYRFEKTLLDTGPQGWSLIDVGIAAEIAINFGRRLTIGFRSTEPIEAYLALPQVYLPKSSPFRFTE